MLADILSFLMRLLLRLRYRVRIVGLDVVARRGTGGILFLPNHPALIDPVVMRTRLQPLFAPHVLADKDQVARPVLRRLLGAFRIIPIPDTGRYGEAARGEVDAALARCSDVLKSGGNLLLYPAGRIYRSKLEDLGASSAVESLLHAAPSVRVVLVRTSGLWGSAFSRAKSQGRNPSVVEILRRTAVWAVGNVLFFSPKREVTLEFVEPENLPRQAGRTEINAFLEAFYNTDPKPNRYVPYGWWEGGGVRDLPEPDAGREAADYSGVPASTREIVLQHLAELTGRKVAALTPELTLAKDLGLDSLLLLDLALWVEKEFGFAVGDAAGWGTVGDVLLAACGMAVHVGEVALAPVPPRWFKPAAGTARRTVAAGPTIPEVFLDQARRTPDAVVLADQGAGVKTFRDVITAVLALQPELEQVHGDYVGIMLPASVAATLVTLGVQFAGKTPVMVNWTVGARNITHSLNSLAVERVLTSKRLVQKLAGQMDGIATLQPRFLYLEDMAARVTWHQKLRAAVQARCGWGALVQACQRVRDTAVILFTSGSENLPKAVPLTHLNLLTNMRDIARVFTFKPDDRIFGILPPFHSFGINCTTFLPLCTGLPVVYHPNPTENGMLARLIGAYRPTLLVGTPTFLGGILRAAQDAQLQSLRVVISGAEKCPETLYATLARRCPQLNVIEGYGITECSPVVSANDEAAPRPGTIGKVMPSLRWVLVDPEGNKPVPVGTPGMLLVTGPSIFGGYLNHQGASPFVQYEHRYWYRTGDLVRADADGVLTFVGRLKRFVKLGGEMISLPAVEEVLVKAFGQPQDTEPMLAVESTPDELNPELVLFTVRELEREAVNARIREAGLSPLHHIRRLVRLEHLPVLGTGKTNYRALKELCS